MLNLIKDIKENKTITVNGEKMLLLSESELKDILSVYRDKVENHTLAKYNVDGLQYLDKDKLYQEEKNFIDSLYL